MKYQSKFIECGDAGTLTEEVNALEREGWEFVSVQLACVLRHFQGDKGLRRDEAPRKPPMIVSKMLATLRREVRPGDEPEPVPARSLVDRPFDDWDDDGEASDDGDDGDVGDPEARA